MPRRTRSLPLAAVAVLVVLLSGCRVDVAVRIDADAAGAGRLRVEVVADRAVAEAVDLSRGLRVDDLRQAGWEVDGPSPRPDGGVGVVATKPFRNAAEATLAVEDLSGADGPFQGFRLRRNRTFARTTTTFLGAVDLAKGIETFGDEGIRNALGGSALGVDLPKLEQTLNGPADGAVGVHLTVRLPGTVTANAPARSGGEARWELPLRTRTELSAQSSAWNTPNLAGAAVALLATLALAVVLVARRRR